jgi:hypothetical protein
MHGSIEKEITSSNQHKRKLEGLETSAPKRRMVNKHTLPKQLGKLILQYVGFHWRQLEQMRRNPHLIDAKHTFFDFGLTTAEVDAFASETLSAQLFDWVWPQDNQVLFRKMHQLQKELDVSLVISGSSVLKWMLGGSCFDQDAFECEHPPDIDFFFCAAKPGVKEDIDLEKMFLENNSSWEMEDSGLLQASPLKKWKTRKCVEIVASRNPDKPTIKLDWIQVKHFHGTHQELVDLLFTSFDMPILACAFDGNSLVLPTRLPRDDLFERKTPYHSSDKYSQLYAAQWLTLSEFGYAMYASDSSVQHRIRKAVELKLKVTMDRLLPPHEGAFSTSLAEFLNEKKGPRIVSKPFWDVSSPHHQPITNLLSRHLSEHFVTVFNYPPILISDVSQIGILAVHARRKKNRQCAFLSQRRAGRTLCARIVLGSRTQNQEQREILIDFYDSITCFSEEFMQKFFPIRIEFPDATEEARFLFFSQPDAV